MPIMGLIMVIGIVAKNGILLLDADERYRAEDTSAREAMMNAAQRRLRPIVMTAIAAICGMLPLAIAVIGALCISVLLSLVATPTIFSLMVGSQGAAVPGAAISGAAEE